MVESAAQASGKAVKIRHGRAAVSGPAPPGRATPPTSLACSRKLGRPVPAATSQKTCLPWATILMSASPRVSAWWKPC